MYTPPSPHAVRYIQAYGSTYPQTNRTDNAITHTEPEMSVPDLLAPGVDCSKVTVRTRQHKGDRRQAAAGAAQHTRFKIGRTSGLCRPTAQKKGSELSSVYLCTTCDVFSAVCVKPIPS